MTDPTRLIDAVIGRNGTGPHVDLRPRINADRDDYPALSKECWDALERHNVPPVMFAADGGLLRLDAHPSGRVDRSVLDEKRLAHELARAADWFRVVKSGRDHIEIASSPRMGVVRDMLAGRSFPLPALDRVVSCPVFGPDGSLRTEQGYHAASRTYYDGSLGLRPVPEHPTDADAEHALDVVLGELLTDFPFVGDSDMAHAVGELVLPFVRAMIDGPCPLHVHESPTRGTGKDLLAEVMCRVSTGADPATMGYSERSEEFVKRLVSTLRMLPEWIVVPNVSVRVENDDLTDVISRGEYYGRLLGVSEILHLPARGVWTMTSNNAQLTPDMARRAVRIRIDARVERPEQRGDFRHPDLKSWVIEHRPEIAWSCLVLVQRWIAAGKKPGTASLGGFAHWARTIGGILACAGFTGFLGDREEFMARADAGSSIEQAFVALWWEKFGPTPVGVSGLYPLAMDEDVNLDVEAKTPQGQRVRLGSRLRQMRDRRYRIDPDTVVILTDAGTLHHGTLWKLERADQS